MAVVELNIIEPENDAGFAGISTVNFSGAQASLPAELLGVPLYYRWYSSLNTVIEVGRYYSMNDTALSAADSPYENTQMGMGSHVITFAASDRPEESDADLEAIQHGGVSGGQEGDTRCVIHVFKANILDLNDGDTVPRISSLKLKAEAPAAWASRIIDSDPPEYVFNETYHAYNRLAYRWLLEPTGLPADRPVLEYVPDPEALALTYDPLNDPISVTYLPALPIEATGLYRLTLFVEDKLGEGIGSHQDQIINLNLTG